MTFRPNQALRDRIPIATNRIINPDLIADLIGEQRRGPRPQTNRSVGTTRGKNPTVGTEGQSAHPIFLNPERGPA